jgi:hypothetical protein
MHWTSHDILIVFLIYSNDCSAPYRLVPRVAARVACPLIRQWVQLTVHCTSKPLNNSCHVHVDGGDRMSLNCSHQPTYCSSTRWYMSMENKGEMKLMGKPRNSEKNLPPVRLCPKQILLTNCFSPGTVPAKLLMPDLKSSGQSCSMGI